MTHDNLQWFKGAGLGLFVHWGIASVAGVDLSWGGMKDRPWCPGNEDYVEHYYDLAKDFQPDNYCPDRWLAAARQAGMEYAVLTAKHHDGYALWPTEYGEFGVKQYMNGRDLVGEFIAACRRQGLKAGLYFSLADWKHPDIETPYVWDTWLRFCERKHLESVDELLRFERFYAYVKGQITELVTRYGQLDMLWFDGNLWNGTVDHRLAEIYHLARHHQPNIVMGRGPYGNYPTTEDRLPEGPLEGCWEMCQSWHQIGGWGYYREETFHDMHWFLSRLAKVTAWGGNFLVNIGPRPSGEFPDLAYERLAATAAWMRDNASSVKNVERGPWPQRCELPITRRRGVWYVHVLQDHQGPVVVRDVPGPASVSLLRNSRPVEYTYIDGTLTFQVPERASEDEVVCISWPAGVEYTTSL